MNSGEIKLSYVFEEFLISKQHHLSVEYSNHIKQPIDIINTQQHNLYSIKHQLIRNLGRTISKQEDKFRLTSQQASQTRSNCPFL